MRVAEENLRETLNLAQLGVNNELYRLEKDRLGATQARQLSFDLRASMRFEASAFVSDGSNASATSPFHHSNEFLE